MLLSGKLSDMNDIGFDLVNDNIWHPLTKWHQMNSSISSLNVNKKWLGKLFHY